MMESSSSLPATPNRAVRSGASEMAGESSANLMMSSHDARSTALHFRTETVPFLAHSVGSNNNNSSSHAAVSNERSAGADPYFPIVGRGDATHFPLSHAHQQHQHHTSHHHYQYANALTPTATCTDHTDDGTAVCHDGDGRDDTSICEDDASSSSSSSSSSASSVSAAPAADQRHAQAKKERLSERPTIVETDEATRTEEKLGNGFEHLSPSSPATITPTVGRGGDGSITATPQSASPTQNNANNQPTNNVNAHSNTNNSNTPTNNSPQAIRKAQDVLHYKGALGANSAYFDDDFTPPNTPRREGSTCSVGLMPTRGGGSSCGAADGGGDRNRSPCNSINMQRHSLISTRGSFQFVRASTTGVRPVSGGGGFADINNTSISSRASPSPIQHNNSQHQSVSALANDSGINRKPSASPPMPTPLSPQHIAAAEQQRLQQPRVRDAISLNIPIPPLRLPAPPNPPPPLPPLTNDEATAMDVLFGLANRSASSTNVSTHAANNSHSHASSGGIAAVVGSSAAEREAFEKAANAIRRLSWHGCPPRCRYACWCLMTDYWTPHTLGVSLAVGNGSIGGNGAPISKGGAAIEAAGGGKADSSSNNTTPPSHSLPPPFPTRSSSAINTTITMPQLPTLNHGAVATRMRRVTEYRTMLKQNYDIVNWAVVLGGSSATAAAASSSSSPQGNDNGDAFSFEMRREAMARVSADEIAMMKQIRKDIPRTTVGGLYQFHTAETAIHEEVFDRSPYVWRLLAQGQQLANRAMLYCANQTRYEGLMDAYTSTVAELTAAHASLMMVANNVNKAAQSDQHLETTDLATLKPSSSIALPPSLAGLEPIAAEGGSIDASFGLHPPPPAATNINNNSLHMSASIPSPNSPASGSSKNPIPTAASSFHSNANNRAMYFDKALLLQQQQQFCPLFRHAAVQQLLQRVLYLWALRHPACGYVQGMNDLLVPVVVTVMAEALCFALLPNTVVRAVVLVEDKGDNGSEKKENDITTVASPPSTSFAPVASHCSIPASASGEAELNWVLTASAEDLTLRMLQRGLVRPVDGQQQQRYAATAAAAEASSSLSDTTTSQQQQQRQQGNAVYVTRAMLSTSAAPKQTGGGGGGYQGPSPNSPLDSVIRAFSSTFNYTSLWFALEADIYALFTRLMDTIQVNFTADAMLKKDAAGASSSSASDAAATTGGAHDSSGGGGGAVAATASASSPTTPATSTTAGAMHAMVSQMEDIVRRVRPDIHTLLTEHLGINFSFFAFRWMNCMLQRETCPPQLGMRLLDTYLSEFSSAAVTTTAQGNMTDHHHRDPLYLAEVNASSGKSSTAILTYHCYVCASLLINVYGPIIMELLEPKGVPLPPIVVSTNRGGVDDSSLCFADGCCPADANAANTSQSAHRNYSFAGRVEREEDLLGTSRRSLDDSVASSHQQRTFNTSVNSKHQPPPQQHSSSLSSVVLPRQNSTKSLGGGGGIGGSRLARSFSLANGENLSVAAAAAPPPLQAPPPPPRIDLAEASSEEKELLSSAILMILQNPALFLSFGDVVNGAAAEGLLWAGANGNKFTPDVPPPPPPPAAAAAIIPSFAVASKSARSPPTASISVTNPTTAMQLAHALRQQQQGSADVAAEDDTRSGGERSMGGGGGNGAAVALSGAADTEIARLTAGGGGGGGEVEKVRPISPAALISDEGGEDPLMMRRVSPCVSPLEAGSASALARSKLRGGNSPTQAQQQHQLSGEYSASVSPRRVASQQQGLLGAGVEPFSGPCESSGDYDNAALSAAVREYQQRAAQLLSASASLNAQHASSSYPTATNVLLIRRRLEEVLSEAYLLKELYQNSPAQFGGGRYGMPASSSSSSSGKPKKTFAHAFSKFVDNLGKKKDKDKEKEKEKDAAPPLTSVASSEGSSAPSSATSNPNPKNKKETWLNNWFGKKS